MEIPLSKPDGPSLIAGQWNKTAAYYAAFVILGLVGAVIGPTLPRLAAQTGSSLSQVSFLFPAGALGYLLGSLLGGRLYDRLPGHRVLVIMLLIISGTFFLVPSLSWLWLLTAVLMLKSLGSGALDVGGNTLLVWVHRSKVGPFMNALHFFFGLGAFLTPVIVAQVIARTGDIQWAFWILALLALPVAAWLALQPSPPSIAETSGAQSAPARPWLVVLLASFFFLYVGAEVGFGDWVFTYTITRALGSEASAAYLTSAFWGALTAGRLLSVPIANRFPLRNVILLDLLGCLFSLSLILIFPHSVIALWGGAIGLGLSMASIFPTTISLAERYLTITGQLTSWFFVGASLGGMFLPWLIGQLFESVGSWVTVAAVLIDLMIALVIFMVIISQAGRPKPVMG